MVLDDNMQALADAAAAGLEEAAERGEMVDFMAEVLAVSTPDEAGRWSLLLGFGPNVWLEVPEGGGAGDVLAAWYGGRGAAHVSAHAVRELLVTMQALEAC